MKNILVTGAAGQLGTAIYDYISEHPNSKFNWYFADIDVKYPYIVSMDLTERAYVEDFIKSFNIDTIINCAAYTNVDKAEDDKELCRKLNVDVPRILAQLSEEYKIRLIHISTDYVYDGVNDKKFKSELKSALEPQSWYGKTKLAGESEIVENMFDYMIIRTSWLYYKTDFKNFVSTVLRIVGDDMVMSVVCDQIGAPTYAGDLAEFIVKSIYDEYQLRSFTMNFSNKGEISWYDFAKEIAKSVDKDYLINPCTTSEYPTKAIRPAYSAMDLSLAKKYSKYIDYEIPEWKKSLHKLLNYE